MAFQRILVAVDSSPIAAHAVDVGVELARAVHGELALVCAIDPTVGVTVEGGATGAERVQWAEDDGKRLLAEFRARATLEAPPLEFVVVGRAASEIIRTATEWLADVIVVGSHGRRGVGRALLGSVAEGVMRDAPCPILVVRAKS